MNDLESLRSALHEQPSEPQPPLDLGLIMAKGKQIRRRRRLVAGGGGVAAAAAVVAIVFAAAQLRQPANTTTAAQPPALVTSSAASPSVVAPAAPSPPESNLPLGEVVSTGIKDKAGEVVFYGVKVDLPVDLPGVGFGVMAGHRNTAGQLTTELECNETRGSDRSPGFHCVDGGETSPQGTVIPVFGYFAGPVARITTTAHGKTVQARLAPWSKDPQVVFFWFDPALVESSNVLTPPIAFDAANKRISP
ncbi:hypothetical protein [Amycolatopsis sp. H20-H5]|uniref:hypothetical protein n=1 Tax=Amycolatopsis sp. H20-H5 TaxID=3046309 RepID=UPI002DBACD75|nr:hypothetical protein [Amycolatopsis sp. H20-H5]MEC3980535.1 hypothetical protein [Amycolatopsis sp. H20-H5]